MSDALTPGSRWRSATCATEVVVVKAPSGTSDVHCGGATMVLAGSDVEPAPVDAAFAEGSVLRKRYADEPSGAELLCVKSGEGSLSIDGRLLPLRGAKPLPASD